MRARSSAWWSARLITGPSIEQASNLLDAPSNKRLTSSTLELDSIRENRLTSNPIVSYPEILYKVIDDQGFREYLRHRYHRNYASWIYTSAKFLAKVVNDPYLLKRLSYRRARGVFCQRHRQEPGREEIVSLSLAYHRKKKGDCEVLTDPVR